jgi:hypothetical protein
VVPVVQVLPEVAMACLIVFVEGRAGSQLWMR